MHTKLAETLSVPVYPEGHMGTRNGKGVQMPTVSPLFQRWVDSYSPSRGPIADVGCAYGLNVIMAARAGVGAVVGVDMDDTHLVSACHNTGIFGFGISQQLTL